MDEASEDVLLSAISRTNSKIGLISGGDPKVYEQEIYLGYLLKDRSGRVSSVSGKTSSRVNLAPSPTSFSGQSSVDLGSCGGLSNLDLINDDLGIMTPSEVECLGHLSALELRSNNMGGCIPYSLFLCTSLETLYPLKTCRLGGRIPSEPGLLDSSGILRSFSCTDACNGPGTWTTDRGGKSLLGEAPSSLAGSSNLIDPRSVFSQLSRLILLSSYRLENLQTLCIANNDRKWKEYIQLRRSQRIPILELGYNNFWDSIPVLLASCKHVSSMHHYSNWDLDDGPSGSTVLQHASALTLPRSNLLYPDLTSLSNSYKMIFTSLDFNHQVIGEVLVELELECSTSQTIEPSVTFSGLVDFDHSDSTLYSDMMVPELAPLEFLLKIHSHSNVSGGCVKYTGLHGCINSLRWDHNMLDTELAAEACNLSQLDLLALQHNYPLGRIFFNMSDSCREICAVRFTFDVQSGSHTCGSNRVSEIQLLTLESLMGGTLEVNLSTCEDVAVLVDLSRNNPSGEFPVSQCGFSDILPINIACNRVDISDILPTSVAYNRLERSTLRKVKELELLNMLVNHIRFVQVKRRCQLSRMGTSNAFALQKERFWTNKLRANKYHPAVNSTRGECQLQLRTSLDLEPENFINRSVRLIDRCKHPQPQLEVPYLCQYERINHMLGSTVMDASVLPVLSQYQPSAADRTIKRPPYLLGKETFHHTPVVVLDEELESGDEERSAIPDSSSRCTRYLHFFSIPVFEIGLALGAVLVGGVIALNKKTQEVSLKFAFPKTSRVSYGLYKPPSIVLRSERSSYARGSGDSRNTLKLKGQQLHTEILKQQLIFSPESSWKPLLPFGAEEQL